MKTSKYFTAMVAGLVALGAVSAQAYVAPTTGSITISVTTYMQGSSTDEAGVVTYTSTKSTLNSATLLARVASATGISLPAGAKLAVSQINNSLTHVSAGDVVIVNGAGQILYDLQNYFETESGYAEIEFSVDDNLNQRTSTTMTTSDLFEDYDGSLYFDIGSYNPTNGTGITGDFYDNTTHGQYTEANNGSRLTSGSASFSGGGEFSSWSGGYDSETSVYVYQPATDSVSVSASGVPANTFSIWGNND